jgi:hypothetical protein
VHCFVDILRTILFKKEGVEESIGTEESAPSGCRMTSIVLVGTTTCAGPYVAAYVYVSSWRKAEEELTTHRNHVKLYSQHLVMFPNTLAVKHVISERSVVCHRRHVLDRTADDRYGSRRTSLEVNLHVQRQNVHYIRT